MYFIERLSNICRAPWGTVRDLWLGVSVTCVTSNLLGPFAPRWRMRGDVDDVH